MLLLFSCLDLKINDELWVEFGAGKKKRWLPIHVYAQHLGKEAGADLGLLQHPRLSTL